MFFLLFLQSRAALSLLAYCYYQIQDYVNASDLYEQLSGMCPDQEQYKIYYAQALYKCGLNAEALKVSAQIDKTASQRHATNGRNKPPDMAEGFARSRRGCERNAGPRTTRRRGSLTMT